MLKINTDTKILAGWKLGFDIGSNNILDLITDDILNPNKDDKLIIKIPLYVENVTSSFVEGFMYALSEKLSPTYFFRYVQVEATDLLVYNFNKFVARLDV